MWKKEIKEHDSLMEASSIGLFWEGSKYYPPDKISKQEEELIRKVTCIEVGFLGIGLDRDSHERLFESYYDFIKQSFINHQCFLIKTDHSKGVKSKVRSYKGIINKKIIPSSYFISVEESLENDYSIILSIVDLKREIYNSAIEWFTDRATSCIIIPMGLEIYNEHFLISFANNYMIHRSLSRINYQKFIIDYCSKGVLILRIGGDGGNEKVTLEIFCLKELKDHSPLLQMLRDIVTE